MEGSTRLLAVSPPSPPPLAGNWQDIPPLILCSYRNLTNRMLIVRVRGVEAFFLERVVFPFEIMTFHCPSDGEVEVITRTQTGEEHSEWVATEQLQAGDSFANFGDDWRPIRSVRTVSVRSNASTICRAGQSSAPTPGPLLPPEMPHHTL